MNTLYDDLEKSLLEAIEISKGNIPLEEKEEMPAKTFVASEREEEIINEIIRIRKERHISQKELAEITGSKQQAISRMEKKENSPSLKAFLNVIHALGLDIKLVNI